MRVPVNLSSEPFRQDRPMLVASAVCGVLLSGLLALLIFLMVNERERARESRVAVNRATGQLRAIAAEQAKVDAFLRQPANAEVLERSLLLNELIARKSVSWTQIFSDLESVMPINVKLISVRLPQINSRNEVMLDMVVGAKEPGAVIGFLKKLEDSPLFGPAETHTSVPPSANEHEPLFKYRVTVNYAQKLPEKSEKPLADARGSACFRGEPATYRAAHAPAATIGFPSTMPFLMPALGLSDDENY